MERREPEQGRRAYPQPIRGPRCALNLKRTEARTRPEGLSSTNVGSEVRGPRMKETEAETGGLILNQYGVRGAWSQHEGGGSKDEAGGLILN